MSPAAPPPSPQEIHRKLSVHSAARNKPPPVTVPPVSGTESDSDSLLTPDPHTLSPTGMVSSIAGGSHTGVQQPLSSIAERRSGSGGEDSEDGDDEGEGGWKTADVTTAHPQGSADEGFIKAGYLWKKGERRKTWKKRWFVLRPAHLAYYKTEAEYQLLRLLELSDVHSCTQVNLKRHDNAFGLISPVRTFYLQANTFAEVQEWVQAIEEARQKLISSTSGTSTDPIPIPRAGDRTHIPPPITPSPPSHVQNATSSDSEDGSPAGYRTQSISSQTRPITASSPSKSQPATATKDPGKTILSGYLMKCGSKRRNWRKRWFVLSGEKLMYSASHMDTKPHRQFAFSDILDALEYEVPQRQHPPLASSPSFAVSESEDPQSVHTFKIVTTKRTLLLCAPTEEDEIKWLGAVRALISRRTGAAPASKNVPAANSAAAVAAASSDVSPNNSSMTSSGSSGIKAKVRRLSLSGSGFSSGGNREEKEGGTWTGSAVPHK